MITIVLEASVAAGAAPAQFAPASINPVPFDGFLEIFASTDYNAAVTALPTLQVQLGQGAGQGAAPSTPLQTSVVPTPVGVAAALQGPDLRNLMMPRTAVRSAQQIQILVGGGTGATAVVRLMLRLYTPEEVSGAGVLSVI